MKPKLLSWRRETQKKGIISPVGGFRKVKEKLSTRGMLAERTHFPFISLFSFFSAAQKQYFMIEYRLFLIYFG